MMGLCDELAIPYSDVKPKMFAEFNSTGLYPRVFTKFVVDREVISLSR